MVHNHLPEVFNRVRERVLGDDEVSEPPEAEQPRGVDVVRAVHARLRRQMRSTALQRKNQPVLHDVHLLSGRRHVDLLRDEAGDELELLVQVLRVHAALGNLVDREIRLAARNRLDQGVVQENVLLFGLHEEVSLRSDVPKKAENVEQPPVFDLLQHRVEDDVCAGPAHARTAVHDDRAGVLGIRRRRLPHEVEDGQGVVGRAMVGPISVVILIHELLGRELLLLLQLQVPYLEGANSVCRHDFFFHELHLDHAVRLDAVLRPIHVTFPPAALHQVRYHHDNGDALFPNHSPEAVERARQRSLRSDEGPRLTVAINEVGVDVVVLLLLARRFAQLDA